MSTGNGRIPKVCICSPSTDLCAMLFAHDLCRLFGHTIRQHPDWELAHFLMPGSLIPKQREQLVREVLSAGDFTHILWLDTDMRFPADTLLRLLAHGQRFVAGSYVERRPPYRPVAFRSIQNSNDRLYTEPTTTGLEEIEAIGFGCVLTAVDIFRAVPEPWFAVGWMPETKEFVGEDVFFCTKAREHGERLFVDHDLTQQIEHLGQFPFAMSHGLQVRAVNGGAVPEPVVAEAP